MHCSAFLEAKVKSASVKSQFVMGTGPIQQLESHPDI